MFEWTNKQMCCIQIYPWGMFFFALSSLQCQVVRTAGAWSTHASWSIFRSIEDKGPTNCSKLNVLQNLTGKPFGNTECSPCYPHPAGLISDFCSSLSCFCWPAVIKVFDLPIGPSRYPHGLGPLDTLRD